MDQTIVESPSFLDNLAYHLLPIRRATVLKNMRVVFGGRFSQNQIEALAKNFYGHFFRVCVENMVMGWMTKNAIKKRVRILGSQHVLDASFKKKGILLLTGHFGNWEFTPVAGMLHFQEFRGRFHIVRRRLVNKFVERVLFKRFYDVGIDVIPKRNALDEVLRCLANNDVVTFIMDQYANPKKDGILVDFFGQKAGTYRSLAMIARVSGAPVIPTFCYRDTDGIHAMRFSEPIAWIEHADPEKEILENTRAYNCALEAMISEKPEQWFWFHRRWKNKP